MRILVTNDDGVEAPGLAALRAVAAEFGQVTVVAPATHQSAASHSVTLTEMRVKPLRTPGPNGFDAIAVAGSPADCVRLAVLKLLDEPPDIVLSGINAGANVGIHVFYSGTVGAAAEAAMLGLPGVALSAAADENLRTDFDRAAALSRPILRRLLERPMRGGDLVNVNFPLAPARPRGVKVTRQSRAEIRDVYDAVGADAAATTYAIRGGQFSSPGSDTDVAALLDGYVTMTPLKVDRTDHEQLEALRTCGWDGVLFRRLK